MLHPLLVFWHNDYVRQAPLLERFALTGRARHGFECLHGSPCGTDMRVLGQKVLQTMQIMYYRTAWNDLKNSPGWFKKLMLLALLNFIPIFGQIVTYGYLYGWARDIAWGVHNPLPERIFGNEDGKLYRRGFFALVIAFVFALAPSLIEFVGSLLTGTGMTALFGAAGNSGSHAAATPGAFAVVFGFVISVLVIVAEFAVALFSWVGTMRMSIYDDLGAGFQISTIWKMVRHDLNGLLKILGMGIIIGLIIGIVFTIVLSVVSLLMFTGVLAAGTAAASESQTMAAVLGASAIGIPLFLVVGFFMAVAVLYAEALVTRAIGYWTYQFNVPQWRGKNDPLPFEYQQTPSYPQQF